MKKLSIVCCLILALLLSGCDLFTPEPVMHTVTFYMDGQLCNEQLVEEGICPAEFTFDVPDGLQLVSWTCNAEDIDPFTTPITEDGGVFRFEARLAPTYDSHMPYLFADSNGNLDPDAALTSAEVQQALEALTDAKQYLPDLSSLPGEPTGADLIQVLAEAFDADSLSAAFPQTEPLTRSEFAQGMNALLGRDGDTAFILGADAQVPADVTQDRTDAAALLEASLRHTPDETGITWAEVELPVADDPGFLLKDGWLYYVQEDHYLLRDGTLGLLSFGADGRYTTGDSELDEMVANILNELSAQNPEADRFTLLRNAYDHCHTQYKYLRKEAYETGHTGWEIEDAKEMFSSGRGNCYNFAAIFWALARGLGYDARAVAGTCTGTDQPHGWVIIQLDGADYFFDPEWQYAYTERGEFDHDMFMIPMDRVSYWTYKWVE